jgi:DNA-binding transcriptional regulator YiaG
MANKSAKQIKFKFDAFEAIHTSASALLKVGASSKTTLRSFDESCLAQLVEIRPQQIKKLREIGCNLDHYQVCRAVRVHFTAGVFRQDAVT